VLARLIACSGWSIGYEDRFGNRRLQQCLLYARFEEHSNLYSHPMDFFPASSLHICTQLLILGQVVDANKLEVVHIDFASHRDATGKLSAQSTAPPPTSEDSIEASGRQRIPPPLQLQDYLPEFLEKTDHKMREDIKPLHVVQPEGVSFSMNGNQISWQKWKLHIGWK
jgi:primary-amine oxidase